MDFNTLQMKLEPARMAGEMAPRTAQDVHPQATLSILSTQNGQPLRRLRSARGIGKGVSATDTPLATFQSLTQ